MQQKKKKKKIHVKEMIIGKVITIIGNTYTDIVIGITIIVIIVDRVMPNDKVIKLQIRW